MSDGQSSETTKNRQSSDQSTKYSRRSRRSDDEKKGVAGFGLSAALESIKKKGAESSRAYPTRKPQGSNLMWSGTVGMFEKAGFKIASDLGKSRIVMRKTV